MNNKKLLRRSLAFISALSFTYVSGLSEITNFVGTSAEPADSSSQADTTTKITSAVTTSIDTSSETTSAVSSSVTVTTDETTAVTTTLISTYINMKFKGNVTEDAAEAISEKIFGISEGEYDSDNKTFKICYESITPPDVKSIVESGKLDTKSGIFVWAKDTDTDRNIDQVYKVTVDGNDITLDLCHRLGEQSNENSLKFNSVSNRFENDKMYMDITDFAVCNGNYYIGRTAVINLNGKNGWYFNDSKEDHINFSVNTNSLGDDSDIYFQYNMDNNGNFGFYQFEGSEKKELKNVGMYEENVRFIFVYDNNVKVDIEGSNGTDFTEKWSTANGKKFEIKKKSYIWDNKKAFEYDVTVSMENSSETVKLYENRTERDLTLDFNSEELSRFLNKKGVQVLVKIRPGTIKCNAEWKNSDNTEDLPTKIAVNVNKNICYIPNLLIENNETYYLSGFSNGEKCESYSISNIITENKITEYKYVAYDDCPPETKLTYTKINSSPDSAILKNPGSKRNDNCRTASCRNGYYYILEANQKQKNESDVSGDTPNNAINDSETTDDNKNKPKYIVLYKTSLNGNMNVTSFDSEWILKGREGTSEYINIISAFIMENDANYPGGKNIIEIPLDPIDKLVYLDKKPPTITSLKLVSPDKDKTSSEWFNGNVKLEFNVNDRDYGNNDEKINDENYNKINELSETINEIASISIGRKSEKSDGTSEKYTFTKNSSGGFSLSGNTTTETFPYVISYNDSRKSDDLNDFVFNFTITPKDGYEHISEELYIEVKDLAGYCSESQIRLNIDTKAPDINDIILENVITSSGNVCHDINYNVQELSVIACDDTKGSGIESVKAEYIYENHSVPFKGQGFSENKYSFGLNIINEIKDTSGKIKVTVTDKAGNSCEKYYDKEVIFDYTRPICRFTEPKAALNKVENKNWFSDFPEDLTLNAYDEKKENYLNSDLSTLIVKLNGAEGRFDISENKIDISKLNGGYNFTFEKNDDTKKVTVFLSDNSDISEPPIKLITIDVPNDNKYIIEAYVTDFSKNFSDKAVYEFYIDEDPPVINQEYKIEKVNIRSFGTFSNHNAVVIAEIHEKGATSGLCEAKLKYCNQIYKADEIKKEAGERYTLKFIIPEKDVLSKKYSGKMEITVSDNVGNISKASLKNDQGSELIVFEDNKPEIDITVPKSNYTNKTTNEEWYSGDVSVKYTITDSDSGICNIDGSVFHETVNNTSVLLNGVNSRNNTDYSKETDAVSSSEFTLSTENNGDPLDGKFRFTISATDNAGNTNDDKSNEIFVYKDITAPEITMFRFRNESEDHGDDDSNFTYINVIPYHHFSNSEGKRIVRVYAKDVNASSGIKSILLMRKDTEGNTTSEEQTKLTRTEDGQYYAEFEIPRNFKGTMSAKAVDNVGNSKDEWKTPSGYVHETPDKHASENTPYEIILPDTEYHDAKGNRLYNNDIDAKVTVKDTVSGIKELNIVYPDGEKSLVTDLDKNEAASGWQFEKTDINLPVQISTVIHQTSNKNDNEINLYAKDYSGNVINLPQPVVFSIDKTKPQISVSFDNNADDSGFKGYYKAARTATIQIRERNFSTDKVKTSYPLADEWVLISGAETEGTDNAVYQNKILFNTDGIYRLTVDCSDICDNQAENAYDSGEFTIDLTAPLINVTFDNNNSKNSNFYNGSRTAEIEVNELNFDPARVKISGTLNGSAEKFPVSDGKINGTDISWNHVSGNVWRTVVPMNDDGLYDLNVTVSDKAGNISLPYHTEFNIDTGAPEISFKGIKNEQAYNDEVKPVIEVNDSNIDFDTIVLSMVGSKNKETVKLEGTAEKSEGKYVFTADDIPHTPQNDDIYTITVQAEDYAGNHSSSQVKISVNRFGSTFGPDEQTGLIDGKAVIETGDIIIHEINTDKHSDDFEPSVKVIKNGSNTVLTENDDYSVDLSSDTETGWFRYTYTLKAKNFADDGVYEIMIYSEDKASNKNYSDSIIKFSVDKTKPSVNYLTIENGGIYKADNKQVIALLNDNMEIDPETIGVTINSKPLDVSDFSFNPETKECSFVIPNSNSTQYVEISASDMAGNQLDISEAKIEDLFISTSGARILLHKTWFKISAAIAAIAALGAGAIILLKKRTK